MAHNTTSAQPIDVALFITDQGTVHAGYVGEVDDLIRQTEDGAHELYELPVNRLVFRAPDVEPFDSPKFDPSIDPRRAITLHNLSERRDNHTWFGRGLRYNEHRSLRSRDRR